MCICSQQIAITADLHPSPETSRCLPDNQQQDTNIDRGIYYILFAAALGTLAEISISLRKRPQ